MSERIEIVAPVAGVVGNIPVAVGDKIAAGDPVIVLQAMKTEFPVEAEQGGRIAEILVSEGQEVEMGAVLARIDPERKKMQGLRKVLIANRGEIAMRIIRACRELGIATVAVFSEADRDSPHVRFADEAREIGPAKPAESYLNLERILAVAADTGADAIHPGYGFFAESAAAARRIEGRGLVFIGPSSEQIALMGDKLEARRVAERLQVPTLGGTQALESSDAAIEAAKRIGFPVIVKPVAGGGGIGNAVVSDPVALERATTLAARLSQQAFGRGTVYVERFLPQARHVEVQIVADQFGTVVALGERECSLQRRYQKLVEETPSTAIDDVVRAEMAAAANLVPGHPCRPDPLASLGNDRAQAALSRAQKFLCHLRRLVDHAALVHPGSGICRLSKIQRPYRPAGPIRLDLPRAVLVLQSFPPGLPVEIRLERLSPASAHAGRFPAGQPGQHLPEADGKSGSRTVFVFSLRRPGERFTAARQSSIPI